MDNNFFMYLTLLYNIPISNNINNVYLYTYPDKLCIKSMITTIQAYKNIKNIYILNCDKKISGYLGFNETKEFIHKLDKSYIIKSIPYLYTHENIINTYLESLSIIEYFNKQSINNIIICSPFYHLPRSIMSIISILIKKKKKLNILPLSSKINDLNTNLVHCQGIISGNSKYLLDIEYNRILKYIKKGDLLELNIINNYIKS